MADATVDGSARVSLRWGDGVHDFALKIAEWRLIQAKCDVGPQELYHRLTRGNWRIDDLRETIRVGLIGGGKTPVEASKLVELYVDARPLLESLEHAIAIAGFGLSGPQDDPLGKTPAAKD